MVRYIEVKSIREGVYLLWRMSLLDEARQFSLGGKRDLLRCNDVINSSIDRMLRDSDGNMDIVQRVIRYQARYKNRFIDDSQVAWIAHDKNACIYFWLFIFRNFTCQNNILDEISRYSRRVYRRNRNKHKILREELSLRTPDTAEQCLMAGLYILDVLPLYLGDLQDILDEIRKEYFRIRNSIKDEFSWFSEAESVHTEWVWDQLSKNNDLLNDFGSLDIDRNIQFRSIPFIYYLWNERKDTKTLFLNTLRKRYANMKHRKKVATKAPVNIRISDSSKKTLVKLEKYFNRNRADVIEFLIDKAWEEMNQKK
ncbi:hypothetical protein E2566_13685 [Pectobacterium punjabense]|uniref:Uncharacterized protein n=4 Tax=Pectobacterium TaxID=122277 RepID=A0ABX6L3V5_9GAMM|nr:hypothetical protein [Pectobacterium punjabense]PTA63465.1 hypothetical protein C9I36_14700 [Pectobacterium punjabense]QJA20911.1 hypothetical protein E2566_13685 [Pectobacterium punjabense]